MRPVVPIAVIVLCAVVVSAVLVWTLLALRRAALRAESVLHALERELRPMLGQIESLVAELQEVSQGARDELGKVRVVVRRAEEVSISVSKVVLAVAGFTRFGQYASLAVGVKKGLGAFITRLRATR